MNLLAAKEWNKVFHENGHKHRIRVKAELHTIGNQNPYFSITGEVLRQAKNNRWMWEMGGCIHEEIIEHFPHLQELVDMHLSDANGVPMHAYDNASYWAGDNRNQERDMRKIAKLLRITEEVALEMLAFFDHEQGAELETHRMRTALWKDICAEFHLPQQWAAEAATARAMLNEVQGLA